MFVCQWHFDIPFGKQSEVVRLMKAWLEESQKSSGFKRSHSNRILVGHIGKSASHITAQHEFETLADFEAAIESMNTPEFRKHSESLASYVVAGTQHWEILRVIS